jgi:hypothetical protein
MTERFNRRHQICGHLFSGRYKALIVEGSGTVISDASGQGNHGALVNAKANTWTNGYSGGGLYFDGTTGAGSTYVTIPDAPSLHINNAISFAAWVRCDDINRDAPILDKEGSFEPSPGPVAKIRTTPARTCQLGVSS